MARPLKKWIQVILRVVELVVNASVWFLIVRTARHDRNLFIRRVDLPILRDLLLNDRSSRMPLVPRHVAEGSVSSQLRYRRLVRISCDSFPCPLLLTAARIVDHPVTVLSAGLLLVPRIIDFSGLVATSAMSRIASVHLF